MPRSAFSPVQEKAIAECFYECASGYDIKTGDGNTALAVPKTKTCTKDGLVAKCWPRFASQHHFWWQVSGFKHFWQFWHIFFNSESVRIWRMNQVCGYPYRHQDLSPPIVIACKTVPLNCAKPFAEFPNGCSGVMTLVENPLFQIYVAFYSYCAQELSGYKSVLDTSVVFDAKTVCSGTYNYNTQPRGWRRSPPFSKFSNFEDDFFFFVEELGPLLFDVSIAEEGYLHGPCTRNRVWQSWRSSTTTSARRDACSVSRLKNQDLKELIWKKKLILHHFHRKDVANVWQKPEVFLFSIGFLVSSDFSSSQWLNDHGWQSTREYHGCLGFPW